MFWKDAMTLVLRPDEVLTTTRAVRRRLDFDRPVSREVVEECLEIAVQAPSGSNKQPWNFLVVGDQDTRNEIARFYRLSFEDYRTSPTNASQLFTHDPTRHRTQERVFSSAEYLAANLHRCPYLLIPVINGRCEELQSARQQAGFWGQIIPATWSFMLAARARGLGTAWTTMHLRYEAEIADILGIPFESFTQAALTPIAYTKGTDFRPASRRPLAEVVHWDRW
jgi:nitroreductase